MSDVALFLLSIAGIFLLGALGEVVFQRTNVPDVIWLILVGILLGPLTGMVPREDLSRIAPFFAAITLVVVLFEGGSALRLGDLLHTAPRSLLLALMTFFGAVGAVTLLSLGARWAGLLSPSFTLTHGLMLGAILGGSSSIIIMPAMAQARIAPKVANLVNLESAITDALCVVGTTALVDVILQGAESASSPLATLGRSFGVGLVVGLLAGMLWLFFLRALHSNQHAYPVTLAALLVLYVVTERLRGSAAFSILTFAIVLGNAGSLSTKLGMAAPIELDSQVRGFHRQMTFIIKSFFFVFIGAMLGPPWSQIAFGALLGLALFAVRLPSVRLSLIKSGLTRDEERLVWTALPRGMAAGVLATVPLTAGVPGTEPLPVVVFACVLTTILIFAVGFPLARRRVPVEAAAPASTVPLPAGATRPEPAGADGVREVVPGGGAARMSDKDSGGSGSA